MRKIIHVDMDAFYASVEIRDNPKLSDKPVIIGGSPDSRSVVCTCNYIAREYGIHSAMPSSKAYRLCPHGVFLHPKMAKYKDASNIIHEIFHRYTDLIEPLSLDEAYLDVTHSRFSPSASIIADKIKKEIWEKTSLRASAGVSYNKFLAKIASDWEKPDGLFVITPDKAPLFIEALPIDKFYGIGKKTAEKMKRLGIICGKDLLKWPLYRLQNHFGKSGTYYYNVVRGHDDRPVCTEYKRKSIGREITLENDINSIDELLIHSRDLLLSIKNKCDKDHIIPRQLNLKIKYSNFETKTRVVSGFTSSMKSAEILALIEQELVDWKDPDRSLRLIGLSFGKLHFLNENVAPGGQLQLIQV